jgi:hypothetical protein
MIVKLAICIALKQLMSQLGDFSKMDVIVLKPKMEPLLSMINHQDDNITAIVDYMNQTLPEINAFMIERFTKNHVDEIPHWIAFAYVLAPIRFVRHFLG